MVEIIKEKYKLDANKDFISREFELLYKGKPVACTKIEFELFLIDDDKEELHKNTKECINDLKKVRENVEI